MKRSTMSVQELSSQMGISLPKAYELVKQPGFPVLRIGTRILIPVDSFNAWLNRKAEGGEKNYERNSEMTEFEYLDAEFTDARCIAMLDHVTIYADGRMVYSFLNGSDITVML